MTDDGFDFGDDSDEDTEDETPLFGTRSAESREDGETNNRFGTATPEQTDSRTFRHRIRTAVSERTVRTGATVALALALVVVIGVVAYPLVMGALDTSDSPVGEAGPPGGSAGVGGTLTATVEHETPATAATPVTTETPTTTAQTAGSTTPQTTNAQTPTATPTPVPTRAFPAGTAVEANETTDGGRPSRQ
ncbi:MAG TPA: hypothetical protein VFJ06_09600 [Halococcus sp.]|nr:hypothetical protein [Halococcus sp.]